MMRWGVWVLTVAIQFVSLWALMLRVRARKIAADDYAAELFLWAIALFCMLFDFIWFSILAIHWLRS